MKHRRMLAGLNLTRAERDRILYGYDRRAPSAPPKPRREPTTADTVAGMVVLALLVCAAIAMCAH